MAGTQKVGTSFDRLIEIKVGWGAKFINTSVSLVVERFFVTTSTI